MGTIVFTAGGFDPIHSGHLELIKNSGDLGDYLVVSVATGEHMVQKKGFEFMPIKDRKAIIQALKYVDEVESHLGSDGTVIENLKRLRERFPNHEIIFSKGGDWDKDSIPEKDICSQLGIKVVDGMAKILNSSSKLVHDVVEKVNYMNDNGGVGSA